MKPPPFPRKDSLLLLTGMVITGCGYDFGFGPEEELPAFPPFDITGPWLLSIYEASPLPYWNLTTDTVGTCTSDEFRITVAYEGPAKTRFLYSGSHEGFRMTCSGISESATQVFNITDTVIVVAAGTVLGEMRYEPCVMVGPWLGCAPEWLFGLDFAGFRLWGSASGDPLSGRFNWAEFSDTVRVWGKWSGQRPPPSSLTPELRQGTFHP